MKYTEVIPIGEKLRSMREKYQLKQDEIVGTEVTRNLISQIENGKAKLTRNTAEIILKHVKDKLAEKDMAMTIDIEYLLEDEEAQAKKILDEFIEELKAFNNSKDSGFEDELKEAEEFLLEWNLIDKKIIICELAGDYFYSNKNFYKASVYYENTKCLMNINMVTVPLISVLQKLSNTYYFMNKLNEGIDICNYALDRFPSMDNKIQAGFLFNSGLYYNYLQQYEKTIRFIDRVINIMDKSEKQRYAQVLLLKASSLYNLKFYEEALEIYEELIEMTSIDDYGHRAVYYNNISEIYIKLKKTDEANKYLSMTLEAMEYIPDDFIMLPHIYFNVAKRCLKLRDIECASNFLTKALNIAKEFKNAIIIKDILLEIINIKNYNIDIDIKKEIKELLSENKTIDNQLLMQIIKYFTALGDKESVFELCDFSKDNF